MKPSWVMPMSEENKHWMESAETAQMRIAQAQALKTQAAESGLRFDAFLVPSQATWILELVERGDFIDPAEAIFVLMQEVQELQQHPDVKLALLKKQLDEGIAQLDRGESISGDEVMANLKERVKNYTQSSPAYWDKIEQPENPVKTS